LSTEPEFSRHELLLDKPLPSSPEIEKQSLGLVFLDNSLIVQLVESVKPEDYYIPSCQKIYSAMITLFKAGSDISVNLVAEELKIRGELEKAGGYIFISSLTYGIPHTDNLAPYVKIIKGKSSLRNLYQVTNSIQSEIFNETDDSSVVIDRATKSILEVASNVSKKGFVHVSSRLDSIIAKSEAMQGHGMLVTGLPTGFQDVDEITSGFQPGDLVIIAARPSMGKTSLVLNLAANAAIQTGKAIGIFSLEMSEESLIVKLLCSQAKVDLKRFRAGMLSNSELNQLTIAALNLEDTQIYIDDTPAISSLDIKSKARRLQGELARHGKELGGIVTDYLQLMGVEKNRSREQEVNQLSADGKTIAKELGIPHIMVSQLSRACESRTDKRPILSDLRESGSIEQNADTVIFLYREEYYNKQTEHKNIAEVIVAKQRNGPTDTKYLRWDPFITRFDSLTQHF
jgi:replicative DNA helicase